MATIDFETGDLVLNASNDLAPADDALLERVKVRLGTARGSCLWDPDFGCRLHELAGQPASDSLLRAAEDAVRQALQPLVDAGELALVAVEATRADTRRMEIVATYTVAGGAPVRFRVWVRV